MRLNFGATNTYARGGRSLTFSGFELLIGNGGADTFTFGDGATFNGSINGGAGNDGLLFTNYINPRATSALASVGATDGFNGTTSG